jgi:hypothetical protein
MISASRRVETPSLHSNASSPGEQAVGGLFFEFEAVRTDLTEMLRAGLEGRARHQFGIVLLLHGLSLVSMHVHRGY